MPSRKELNSKFQEVMNAYFETEMGYDNLPQLQEWRKNLVYINSHLAYQTKEVSADKIREDRGKDTARAKAFERLKDENPSKAVTALKELVGNTPEYKEWSERYAKAYGAWQAFTDFQEAVKLTIDSLASHMRMINTAEYLDPK